MTILEKIQALRALMEQHHMDAYLIPTDDSHQSEYVGAHFKTREFITGFTGSAGTAVITKTEACLWTDGRYFLQAESQLAESTITLFKTGEPGVLTLEEYLAHKLPENGILGFDGRVVSADKGRNLQRLLSGKSVSIDCSSDLIDQIWTERPPLSSESAFALEEKYTGETTAAKLSRIRHAMKNASADIHIIASLDDVNWMVNLRGNDIDFCPLVLSYALITMSDMKLYIDDAKLSPRIREALTKDNISVHPYNAIYEDARHLDPAQRILIDPSRLNYALFTSLPEDAAIIEQQNPTVLMKSMKNKTELKNIINAHIKDGIAVTRFMFWLKKNMGNTKITELSVAKKMDDFRREQTGYLGQSFEPICGYGAHGAIVHYSATPDTNASIVSGNLLLTDTGGAYYEGSTDITRTFACGDISKEMKQDFTTVLLCNLRLSRAVFLHGVSGYNLDVLARQPLWERGMNFNHGTGHGVGYLMNIHEAPVGFRIAAGKEANQRLEEGMIITDEPGLYVAGSHGIRIENELLVRKGIVNEYGQFMYFEPVTYVPIDLDAVDASIMTDIDKQQLNQYHAKVYEVISPHLDAGEREWLKTCTRPI